jgi:periplasmic protein CpxP/Spy
MSAQTKSKLYLLIIGMLAIANIALLYFLLNGNHKPSKKRGGWAAHDAAARAFLQNDIGFNQQQLIAFDTLVKQHREKMKAIMDENKKGKENQFKQLGSLAFTDSAIAIAVKTNAQNQSNVDMQLFQYLKNLRKLCTADQLTKYDTSYYKMWNKKQHKKKN